MWNNNKLILIKLQSVDLAEKFMIKLLRFRVKKVNEKTTRGYS